MIDIIRIWFREEVRDRIPTLSTFSWGVAFGLSATEHAYKPLGVVALITAAGLMIWDLWLKRGEVKRRKEELYDMYRSEFETEKFRPVKNNYGHVARHLDVVEDRPHAADGWDRVSKHTLDKDQQ